MATGHLIVPIAEHHLADIATIELRLFDQPTTASTLASLFANPAFIGFVLKTDPPLYRGVASYIFALNDGHGADLVSIGTAPEFQRSGYALSLLRHLAAAMHERGAETLMLEVAFDNMAAQSLYARAGFIEVAIRPNYYRRAHGAVDAMVMQIKTRHAVP